MELGTIDRGEENLGKERCAIPWAAGDAQGEEAGNAGDQEAQQRSHSVQRPGRGGGNRSSVDREVQFLAPVVASDRSPPGRTPTARAKFVHETRGGYEDDLAVPAKSTAEFGVFAIEEEALIE